MELNVCQIENILENLQDIAENDVLEFKGAKGGFPGAFWETYSAFANTNGGVVILGIKDKNGHLQSDNLDGTDIDKLQKDLWSGLSNKNTTNINLLNNADVKPLKLENSFILIIRIPRANRD